MRCVAILVLATTLFAAPAGAEPNLSAAAERYNDQGKKLFSKGELEGAARKFRAAIAIDAQARYFFNLCFVLNARYQLDAALGACGEVAEAKGTDERLKSRAADLMKVIRKKQAAAREHDQHQAEGEGGGDQGKGPIDAGPAPDDAHAKGSNDSEGNEDPGDGGARVADRPADEGGDDGELTSKPVAYAVPFGRGRGQRVAIRSRPEPAPRSYHLGLLSGITFASQTESTFGGSSDTRTGFAVGAFLATSFSRPVVGQVELLYMQKGAQGDQGDLDLDYLAVPVVGKLLLKVGRTTHFYADGGLSLAFLIHSNGTDQLGMPVDVGSQISRFEISWVLGGGVAWHSRGKSAILLDLRHERGLNDVDKLSDFEVKSRVTTLRVGYAF